MHNEDESKLGKGGKMNWRYNKRTGKIEPRYAEHTWINEENIRLTDVIHNSGFQRGSSHE